GPPFLFRRPNTSEILPVGRAAFTSILPSGSLFTLIFSPGCTPRCSSTSLRKVTWPLAVMVSVVMRSLGVSAKVRQKNLTFKKHSIALRADLPGDGHDADRKQAADGGGEGCG